MSLTGSILEYLPDYIPKSDIKIDVTDDFEYRSESTPKTVYTIENGPVERIDELTATVSGTTRNLVVGEEVELRDTTGDAQYDSVAFIDGDVIPDDDTEFEATYVIEPVVSRYVGSFDEDIDIVGDRIDDSIDSKYINSASGRELDRIGSSYGSIGQRLGREDPEYRSFLRSIADAFDATGTKSGIKFVAGAVLELDPDDIEVVEDFDQTAFTVRAEQPEEAIITESFQSLIESASPSGVGLYQPLSLYIIDTQFGINGRTPLRENNRFGVTVTGNISSTDIGRHGVGLIGEISSTDIGRHGVGLIGEISSTDIGRHGVGITQNLEFEDPIELFGLGSGLISSDDSVPVESQRRFVSITSTISDQDIGRHGVGLIGETSSTDIGRISTEISLLSTIELDENLGSSTISSGSSLT